MFTAGRIQRIFCLHYSRQVHVAHAVPVLPRLSFASSDVELIPSVPIRGKSSRRRQPYYLLSGSLKGPLLRLEGENEPTCDWRNSKAYRWKGSAGPAGPLPIAAAFSEASQDE